MADEDIQGQQQETQVESAAATTQEGTEASDSTATDSAEQLYEVRVDGQTQKVPMKELLEGYSRTADYTRKSQELAELRRKADYAERLMAERATPRSNPNDAIRQRFLSKYKDMDPGFVDMMLEATREISGMAAKETMEPLTQQQAADFERQFLSAHPDVKPGTDGYNKIAELVGRGVDANDAYSIVYQDSIVQKKLADAIKARDEATKLKLKQSKTTGVANTGSRPKSFDDAFEKAYAVHGGD